MKALFLKSILFVVLAFGLTGCFTSDSESESNPFVGVWALYMGNSMEGRPYWYVHFLENGDYFFANNEDGTQVRVSGTYLVEGNTLVGPFRHPLGGEGRSEATLVDGVIRLDFIEYWHTPHKVLSFVGQKVR
jgi:hypothetical protein